MRWESNPQQGKVIINRALRLLSSQAQNALRALRGQTLSLENCILASLLTSRMNGAENQLSLQRRHMRWYITVARARERCTHGARRIRLDICYGDARARKLHNQSARTTSKIQFRLYMHIYYVMHLSNVGQMNVGTTGSSAMQLHARAFSIWTAGCAHTIVMRWHKSKPNIYFIIITAGERTQLQCRPPPQLANRCKFPADVTCRCKIVFYFGQLN
jgi:hypothetical protein